MLLVLLVIFAGLFVLAVIKSDDYSDSDSWSGLAAICFTLALACIIAICIVGYGASKSIVIDKKIAMYEEQNSKIENEVSSAVTQYSQYESDTFKYIADKNDSPITLATIYPELKANTLVQQEVALYTDNNNKITALKEDKIDYGLNKWWLYFGG